ncbi:MAG: HAD family hydrolase [Candidatus Obscuribacterales bacterium]|nr:HAD family hydrolase [Candidatus Obscuribacterales bacterium]
MSKLRIVDYDKDKPTVFIDLNETLITSLMWNERQKATKLGLSFPRPGILVEGITHWLRPDAEQFLKELTAKGYQLFILTRGPHPYQAKVIDQLGLSQYFLQVLGRKHYDKRKLQYTTSCIPRPKYFVLIDDADLNNDIELRSITKLQGLGLKLPSNYEYWTAAHKSLADRHFVLCDSWAIEQLRDLDSDPPSLLPYITVIEEKLQNQAHNS